MEALREYMKATGINQVELAKRVGVSATQMNHWLRKRRAPSVTNLKHISEKTGIKLEKLAEDL